MCRMSQGAPSPKRQCITLQVGAWQAPGSLRFVVPCGILALVRPAPLAMSSALRFVCARISASVDLGARVPLGVHGSSRFAPGPVCPEFARERCYSIYRTGWRSQAHRMRPVGLPTCTARLVSRAVYPPYVASATLVMYHRPGGACIGRACGRLAPCGWLSLPVYRLCPTIFL